MKNLVLMAIVMGCVFISGCASQYEFLALQEQVNTLQAQVNINTNNSLLMRDAFLKIEKELKELKILKGQLETYIQDLLILKSDLQEYDKEVVESFKKILEGMMLIAEQVDKNTVGLNELAENEAAIAKILDMSQKIVKIFNERINELEETQQRIIDQLAGERL